ncbi:DUF2938 domain-containing protein [Shewanella sp. KCT]|uniref:DUF2938 domain-containing protein n=1 Tax=Shewanella sp. KCT TaxID=2569535 RepID=UPI0011829669|nr:DUF2938 domain-containing protein [Shewanella sp. KCT]TVP15729.1 hypothetical protein AYI87_04480 [Shewanella sp. KCT]
MSPLIDCLLIGLGATLIMDLWGLLRHPLLGMPLPSYYLVGRWLGHMPKGQFRHQAITEAAPVPGETLIGWLAHYLIGVSFAALLILITGSKWLTSPSLTPALAVGLVTVLAPFLLMQPGMGAGIAASRLPNPGQARLHSLLTHGIFGLGLYLSALGLRLFH